MTDDEKLRMALEGVFVGEVRPMLVAEIWRLRGELEDSRRSHEAAKKLALRVARHRNKLAAAVHWADEFLGGTAAYGLARREKGEIREAFREALAGMDAPPAGDPETLDCPQFGASDGDPPERGTRP
jgi:hypothetical protein